MGIPGEHPIGIQPTASGRKKSIVTPSEKAIRGLPGAAPGCHRSTSEVPPGYPRGTPGVPLYPRGALCCVASCRSVLGGVFASVTGSFLLLECLTC